MKSQTPARLAPSLIAVLSISPLPAPIFRVASPNFNKQGAGFSDILMTLYRPYVPENRSTIRARRLQKLKFHTLKCLCESYSRSAALQSKLTGKQHTFCKLLLLFFFVFITILSTASKDMKETKKTLIRIVDFRCEIWTGVLANKNSWAELQKICVLLVYLVPFSVAQTT
jgi:hypothetical protein